MNSTIKKDIEFDSNIENSLPRTKFLVSVGYLILQALIPGLVLFFMTGRDFSFTFHLPFWLMIILSLSLIIVTFTLTLLTYKIKLHHLDQFTYTIPFAFVLVMFYLSGYFLSPQQILIRFIISIAGAVIGILLTSIVLLLFIRRKQMKSYINIKTC